MQLNNKIANEIESFLNMMLQEYKGNSGFKKDILANHLSILLYKTKELLQSHKVNIKSSSRSMKLVNQFKIILNDDFKNLLKAKADKIVSIKEMANELNVHPNYFE